MLLSSLLFLTSQDLLSKSRGVACGQMFLIVVKNFLEFFARLEEE